MSEHEKYLHEVAVKMEQMGRPSDAVRMFAAANYISRLEKIRDQAIIDTREGILCGSYLDEPTEMMRLLGMDDEGNIKTI